MMRHDDIWRAIDALAAEHGLSASGLARKAGLDPTAFNPSKRIGADGRARWPSTESVAKVLAATGWGSRRACEDLIAAVRVRVNGEVAELGRRVDPANDLIEVDGAPVGTKPGLVYYLLNKPQGVVTTAKDTHGRPTVVEIVARGD